MRREIPKLAARRSAGQVTQREKFADCIAIVRALGPMAYKVDWDRAIGQLAGFQSWTSVLLDAMDPARLITAPPSVSPGTLPVFTSLAAAAATTAGQVTFTWTAATTTPGAATDMLNVAAIPAAAADRATVAAVYFKSVAIRSAATGTITGLTAGDSYIFIAWGQNAAGTLFTPTSSFTITAPSVVRKPKAA